MFRALAIVGVTCVFMLAGAGYGVLQWMASDLPSPARLQSIQPSVKTVVYDAYGVKTVPAVREAIEQKQWSEANQQIEVVAGVINAYAAQVDRAAELAK